MDTNIYDEMIQLIIQAKEIDNEMTNGGDIKGCNKRLKDIQFKYRECYGKSKLVFTPTIYYSTINENKKREHCEICGIDVKNMKQHELTNKHQLKM